VVERSTKKNEWTLNSRLERYGDRLPATFRVIDVEDMEWSNERRKARN
jgi:hypothetical protein